MASTVAPCANPLAAVVRRSDRIRQEMNALRLTTEAEDRSSPLRGHLNCTSCKKSASESQISSIYSAGPWSPCPTHCQAIQIGYQALRSTASAQIGGTAPSFQNMTQQTESHQKYLDILFQPFYVYYTVQKNKMRAYPRLLCYDPWAHHKVCEGRLCWEVVRIMQVYFCTSKAGHSFASLIATPASHLLSPRRNHLNPFPN
jgi:hypothetical protein